MKIIPRIVLLLLFPVVVTAQPILPDNLQEAFRNASNDSIRFRLSRAIYTFYEEINRDSALHYAKYRYELAKKNSRKIEEAHVQGQMAYQQIYLGDFSEALKNLDAAYQIVADAKEGSVWELTPFSTPGKNRQVTLSMLNHMYGHLKLRSGSGECLYFFKEGRKIGLEIGNAFRVTVADMVLGSTYLMMNQPDSAFIFASEGEAFAKRGGVTKYLANIYFVMGEVYRLKGKDSLALAYYDQSLNYAIAEENSTVVAATYESKIRYYLSHANADSILMYGKKQLAVLRSLGAITALFSSENNLGNAYQSIASGFSMKKQTDSANKYLRLALAVNDSLTALKQNRLSDYQRLTLDQQIRLQNEEKNRLAKENSRRMYLLFAGIAVALLIILLIYRNNRQKQKAFDLLQKQKEKTDMALQELKSAQAQLIQAEKMASLGELTAGIAHEIQNPLNFVNNFSEVSAELIGEMKEELQKGDLKESLALADDIQQNLEKINHHGKRADAIVKGMLEHSRAGSGDKMPTDINALADEYLRLAYHGLRAKNQFFNAELKTNFDPAIGNINIIPQDIGRVLLNLINNALYAVNEKSRKGEQDYSPAVTVTTIREGKNVKICIEDNGSGIPENIRDKIFQPFFTTKPTGLGTGLGLSLAYDIVKAHGGNISVTSAEGVGTSFILQLPLY